MYHELTYVNLKYSKAMAPLTSSRYQCTKCSASFNRESSLRSHAKVHEIRNEIGETVVKEEIDGDGKDVKPPPSRGMHICKSCPQSFSLKRDLVDHEAKQHNFIRYSCNLCPAAFKRRYRLKLHALQAHKTLKPYLKKISDEDQEKIKTNYSCQNCSEIFSTKSSLILHEINPNIMINLLKNDNFVVIELHCIKINQLLKPIIFDRRKNVKNLIKI